MNIRQKAAALIAVGSLLFNGAAGAAPVDDAVADLQHEWETVKYKVPTKEKEARFEALAAKAHKVSVAFPDRAEPLIWEGIVVSSLAGAKGGLGALGLVKQAKTLYEGALKMQSEALEG